MKVMPFILLLCCCPLALSQDIVGGSSTLFGFRDLRTAVQEHQVRLNRRSIPQDKQAQEVDALLAESSETLAFLVRSAKNHPVSSEYSESTSDASSIFSDIKARGTIGEAEWKQLQAVNADLKVKANHAEKALASGAENAFELIEVIVHTKKNGKELADYQVWYVKEAYENEPGRYQTFDRFSSPATRKLPPGRYLMWTQATDGTKTQGPKTPKEFGDGQAIIETDLSIP